MKRMKIILHFFYTAIGPVEKLFFNISINEYAIVVWNPPSFVSDDVNSLSYRVVIINDNDNALVDIVTTEWEYEVSIDILSICSIYTIIVTAYDEKYTSDSSIIQEEYIGGNYALLLVLHLYSNLPICLYAYMPIFHNPNCLYADPIRYCLCEIYSCIYLVYNCSHMVQC